MPITDPFMSRTQLEDRELVQKSNPYHDASGAFTSKAKAKASGGGEPDLGGAYEKRQAAIAKEKAPQRQGGWNAPKPSKGNSWDSNGYEVDANGKYVTNDAGYVRNRQGFADSATQAAADTVRQAGIDVERVAEAKRMEDPKYREEKEAKGKALREASDKGRADEAAAHEAAVRKEVEVLLPKVKVSAPEEQGKTGVSAVIRVDGKKLGEVWQWQRRERDPNSRYDAPEHPVGPVVWAASLEKSQKYGGAYKTKQEAVEAVVVNHVNRKLNEEKQAIADKKWMDDWNAAHPTSAKKIEGLD